MRSRLATLFMSAALGACLALVPSVLLALIVLAVSRGFSQPLDVLSRTLPFLVPAGVLVGVLFLRPCLHAHLRQTWRTAAAAILSSTLLGLLFGSVTRSVQSAYFSVSVLRPAFPSGTTMAAVQSRLGPARAEHRATTFALSPSFAPCDVRTAVTVLEYSHPHVPDTRLFYFDRSGALLCDDIILITH